MPVTPYLFLDGRCEEAIEFYKKIGFEVKDDIKYGENQENRWVEISFPPK